jgi:hypothetical protein
MFHYHPFETEAGKWIHCSLENHGGTHMGVSRSTNTFVRVLFISDFCLFILFTPPKGFKDIHDDLHSNKIILLILVR